MGNCIFCKIIKGDIPSKKIYEDDKVLAFYDVNPEAPIHFLIIPKNHIKNVSQINEENSQVISHIFKTISKITKELSIDEDGFRVITNSGENGGQTVDHLHFHVLGGRKLEVKLG